MTPKERQALEALIEEWRYESLELQADYDAKSRQVARSKGLHDCANDLKSLLAFLLLEGDDHECQHGTTCIGGI